MFSEIELPLVVILSVVAFLLALSWAVGIRRAREGDWRVLGQAGGLVAASVAVVIALRSTRAFTPTPTTGSWLVVGLVFVVTFANYFFLLPWLSKKFGELVVDMINFCGTCFLLGAGAFWFGVSSADWDSGARGTAVMIALVAFAIGVLFGISRFLEWGRDNL